MAKKRVDVVSEKMSLMSRCCRKDEGLVHLRDEGAEGMKMLRLQAIADVSTLSCCGLRKSQR